MATNIESLAATESVSATTAQIDNPCPLHLQTWINDGPPSGFDDGDLTKANDLVSRVKSVGILPAGVGFIESELDRLREPLAAIHIQWETSGNVKFSKSQEKFWLELRHSAVEDSFIGTLLMLPIHFRSLEFDIHVQQPSSNDTLDLSYRGLVFHTLNLADMVGYHHISIPLEECLSTHPEPVDHPNWRPPHFPTEDGLLRFRLRGSDNSPIVVGLTNFSIVIAPNVTQELPNGQR